MNNWTVYPHPKLKRDYKGRTVRTTRQLSNGYVVIPASKIAVIEAQSPKGSALLFSACECCGMKARITHIDPADIEFIQAETSTPIQENHP